MIFYSLNATFGRCELLVQVDALHGVPLFVRVEQRSELGPRLPRGEWLRRRRLHEQLGQVRVDGGVVRERIHNAQRLRAAEARPLGCGRIRPVQHFKGVRWIRLPRVLWLARELHAIVALQLLNVLDPRVELIANVKERAERVVCPRVVLAPLAVQVHVGHRVARRLNCRQAELVLRAHNLIAQVEARAVAAALGQIARIRARLASTLRRETRSKSAWRANPLSHCVHSRCLVRAQLWLHANAVLNQKSDLIVSRRRLARIVKVTRA